MHIACQTMPKRAGGDVVTVDVYRDLYDAMRRAAEHRGETTKTYINRILFNSVKKMNYIERNAPYLSVDSCDDNKITIKDEKSKRLIDVFKKDGKFFCEDHEGEDGCEHIQYVLVVPDCCKLPGSGVLGKTAEITKRLKDGLTIRSSDTDKKHARAILFSVT